MLGGPILPTCRHPEVRRAPRWPALVGLCAWFASAVAAEWTPVDPEDLEGVDGLIDDDPILMLVVDDEGDAAVDLRLERVDPMTGLLAKPEFDEIGCAPPWRPAVTAERLRGGDSIMWFFTSRMPLSPYRVVRRASGSNAPWEPIGETFWIVTQPVARVVPCHDAGARISIARQPAIQAARDRVRQATVRVIADGRAFQGVVVNPWGHVVTAAHLVGEAGRVRVGFQAGSAGMIADRLVTYRPVSDVVELPPTPAHAPPEERLVVLVPAEDDVPEFFPSFAPLVDRARLQEGSELTFRYAAWLHASRRGSGEPLLLRSGTPPDTRVPWAEAEAPAPLLVTGPLSADDVGGPVFDHAGRVWAILVDTDRAQWATTIVDRYQQWAAEGMAPRIRGPLPPGGAPQED